MGNDVEDLKHPKNYWHHNSACQEYLTQLKKVQREVDVAIDLARGTYFVIKIVLWLKKLMNIL